MRNSSDRPTCDIECEIGFGLVRVKNLDKWRHFDPKNNLSSVINHNCPSRTYIIGDF